jgi:hypothetical protein
MKAAKIQFRRVVGEALLIFASVFIAIWLESAWQDHSDITEARVALGQLLGELRADQAFQERVKESQMAFRERNEIILSWLADPESPPSDSVQDAFENYSHGITIWPRRATWTTMVAAGQLGLINDKSLVASLGDFYEHKQRRLEYNQRLYDESVELLTRGSIPGIWDFRRRRLMTSDYERIEVFHGKIRNINDWNRWYLSYIAEYATDLSDLIHDVAQYLQAYGYAVALDNTTS